MDKTILKRREYVIHEMNRLTVLLNKYTLELNQLLEEDICINDMNTIADMLAPKLEDSEIMTNKFKFTEDPFNVIEQVV